jgi:hypothetical protein
MRILALTIVRERYPDFGRTFACEKLREVHGLMAGQGNRAQANG